MKVRDLYLRLSTYNTEIEREIINSKQLTISAKQFLKSLAQQSNLGIISTKDMGTVRPYSKVRHTTYMYALPAHATHTHGLFLISFGTRTARLWLPVSDKIRELSLNGKSRNTSLNVYVCTYVCVRATEGGCMCHWVSKRVCVCLCLCKFRANCGQRDTQKAVYYYYNDDRIFFLRFAKAEQENEADRALLLATHITQFICYQ